MMRLIIRQASCGSRRRKPAPPARVGRYDPRGVPVTRRIIKRDDVKRVGFLVACEYNGMLRIGFAICATRCVRVSVIPPSFLPPSLPPSPLSLSSPRSKKAELGEAGRLLLGLKFGSCSTSCGLRLWIWEEIRGLWVACFCVDPPDSEDMKSKMRSRMGERAATFSPIKESPPAEKAAEWEFRPGGMLVQKRDPDADAVAAPVPAIRVKVKYGAVYHEIYISSQATFGKNSNRSFLFLLLAVAVGPAKVVDELTE
ncbi:hypothetical protein BHE74_00046915 [Ensete ventricosum]|nr:hypothetical protein BHE74_00046915 [Ensete ventricosum]